MTKTFRIKRFYCAIYFTCILTVCFAQKKTHVEYQVGTIPNIDTFERMTGDEIFLNSLKMAHDANRLKRMLDGTAFLDGVSEEIKQENIEYQKTISQSYKDNRSRYYLEMYVNEIKDTNYLNDIDTLTTECSCYLSGETIRIKMGIWVFGGFAFSIDLRKNTFTSNYWEDTHKQKIYKSRLSDKRLVDNVFVENEKQTLVLMNEPTFEIGESIIGQLTFKTHNYFRANNYNNYTTNDIYDSENMDRLYLKGSVYFKCIVRKKTMSDE